MDEMRYTPSGSIMKGPPQPNVIKIIKDTVAMKKGGKVMKKPAKGSKAMKDKMAKLRAMKK